VIFVKSSGKNVLELNRFEDLRTECMQFSIKVQSSKRMHATRDTLLVMFLQSCARARDARR
jgi:hypothetical protein